MEGVKGGGAGRRRGQSRGQGREQLKWRETGGLGRQDRSNEEEGTGGHSTGVDRNLRGQETGLKRGLR